MCSTCVGAQSHCRLTLPFKRTCTNIHINLVSPETRVHAECLHHGISLLVCTQLSSKTTVSGAQHTSVKTEFNVKWPIQVIQGMLFWDQWKADFGPYCYIIKLALSLKLLKI